MTKILWSLVLMNLTLACGKGFDKKSKPTVQRTQEAQEVDTFSINQIYLNLLNDYRVDHKLRPLTYSAVIEEIAKEHSKGMAKHSRTFSHLGMGQRCRQIKKRLAPYKICGEIIAMGQENPKAVLEAWINSPKHKQELSHASYTTTALGLYKDEQGVIYWTQMFVEL